MIGENVRLEGPDFVPTNRFRGFEAVADAVGGVFDEVPSMI